MREAILMAEIPSLRIAPYSIIQKYSYAYTYIYIYTWACICLIKHVL